MRGYGWAAAALVVLTSLNFLAFPGHTFLQSDTQIYMPILERLWDPTVFRQEILAQQPHVSFTIYDEAAITLRKLTGGDFQWVLAGQQIVFRGLGLTGVYLMGLSLGFARAQAILLAAVFGLGATIMGPSILIFEYEPVPRGSAIGLTVFALGLIAKQYYWGAGCAAGLAFLYHVPAVYPYWLGYFLLALIPSYPERMRKHIQGLVPMAAAVLLLLILSHLQTGTTEKQVFFTRVDDAQDAMIRARASYNYVSMWPSRNFWHYGALWLAGLLALKRIWSRAPKDWRILAWALPLVGMLSMPVSWLLLEQLRWGLAPQIQPARAVLYVTAFAVILSAAAGIAAAEGRRWLECGAWFLIPFSLPAQTRTLQYLMEWGTPASRHAALVAIGLAILATASLYAAIRLRRGWAAVLAFAAIPFWALPNLAKVRNYPPLHHAEMDALAHWAREQTPVDAVFLFPAAGRDLAPGIFRAKALRAVYVDWKGGGQINYLRNFMNIWLPRWRQAMEPKFVPDNPERYSGLGIDYVVVTPKQAFAARTPIWKNDRYQVYPVPKRTLRVIP
jgi:hypothetical protein